ncbi:MAG: PAS domain S-box protein [Thermanaerothrix sp.]|uniref:PAS domain S-box protein n=1 Tax=Thermanaerothrix sp. TaxID=2972675 RepID=UPI003C7D6660
MGNALMGWAEALWDASPLAVVVWREGEAGAEVIAWNRAAERLFGWEREAIQGQSVYSLLLASEDDIARLREVVHQPRESGDPATLALACRSKLGRIVWTTWSLMPLPDSATTFLAYIEENTEPHVLAEALRHSEATFESLMTSLEDGVTILRYGRIIVANAAMAHLLGLAAPQALIGKDWLAYLSPESRALVETEIPPDRAELDSSRRLELTFLRPDGQHKTTESTFLTVPFAGRPHIIAIHRDITERKRWEQQLRVSEERYRTLFETMLDGFALHEIILDEQGDPYDYRFLQVNPAFERLTGLSAGQVIGRTARELLPNLEPNWIQVYGRVALTGQPAHFEEFSRDLGRWFEVTVISPRRGQFATFFSDISARVQAEQMQRLLTRALEQADVVLMLADLDGRLTWANPAFTRLTGYTLSEAMGTPLLRYCGQPQQLGLAFTQVRERGEAWEGECSGLRKGGEPFIARVSISPVEGPQGEISHIAVVAWEITEQKHHEQQREALLSLANALRGTEVLETMLPIIGETFVHALEASAVTLSLYDADRDVLVVRYAFGLWQDLAGRAIRSGEGITGHAFIHGEPFYLDHVLDDPHRLPDPRIRYPSCMAVVPLVAGEHRIGAITVGRERRFRPADQMMLISLSEFAASALHRGLHYHALQQALGRLNALRQIDLAILSQGLNPESMQVLARETREHIAVDAVSVWIYWPEEQVLRLSAGSGFQAPLPVELTCRPGEGLAGAVVERREPLRIDVDLSKRLRGMACPFPAQEEGFVAYYGLPLLVQGEPRGVLEIYHRAPLTLTGDQSEFLVMLAQQGAIAVENVHILRELHAVNRQLRQAYDQTLESLIGLLELRDDETEGHSRRVAEFTLRIAREMGMSEEQLVHIRRGALLHDIGKVGVPDAILLKKGPLTAEEWAVMQRHPVMAFDILSKIPFLRPALDIPYCHHERWDGSGYPRGLKGEQIPLAARIFAVVDVWDALLSQRPYRPPWPRERVRDYIREQAGKLFDPHVVEIFLRLEADFTPPPRG